MTHPFTSQDIILSLEIWDLMQTLEMKTSVKYGEWYRNYLGYPCIVSQGLILSSEDVISLLLPHQVEVVMEEQLGWRKISSQHSTDHWQTNNEVMGPVVKRPVHITHPTMITRYLLALVEGLKRRKK